MDLNINDEEESDIAMDYVREASINSKKLCQVCKLDEFEKHKTIWHRYELKCGHQCHTRCFRRFSKNIGTVACPTCGEIEQTLENKCCWICNTFGHWCNPGFLILKYKSNDNSICQLCGNLSETLFTKNCFDTTRIKSFSFCHECYDKMDSYTSLEFLYEGEIYQINNLWHR